MKNGINAPMKSRKKIDAAAVCWSPICNLLVFQTNLSLIFTKVKESVVVFPWRDRNDSSIKMLKTQFAEFAR